MSYVASWRTALRVARREARRAKGRSALVVAMIALPVLFLTFAAVSYDMFTLTGSELADRTMGTGTARVLWTTHEPAAQMPNPDDGAYNDISVGSPGVKAAPNPDQTLPTRADLLAALPSGSTADTVRRGTVSLRIDAQRVAVFDAVSVDASTPRTAGFVTVKAGRVPTVTAEVALTEQAMARLGVGIGGVVTLADGTHPYTVVGQVEFPSLLAGMALFAPVSDPLPAGQNLDQTTWLVHTPQPITWSDVLHYNTLGMIVTSRAVLQSPPPADQILYGYGRPSVVDSRTVQFGVLVGGLALLEIVLMAGPAFAVSARRRQRQLALVAANGGTPAQVRRIVLADGVVLGGIGAVLGIALGIVAAFGARPLLEAELAHVRAGGYRVFPTALLAIAALAVVTGVLAALVPAFITARQNIISSLAGRRGITRSRKRWLVLGIVVCALGMVTVVAGTSKVDTNIMLAGIILGELGLVLCTPSLVGLIARLGRVLPLGPRIALRDAARNRASAAPAISAVMAAVAGSVAIGLYFSSNVAQQTAQYTQRLPTGYVELFLDGKDADRTPQVTQASSLLRSTMPVTETHAVATVSCAPAVQNSYCDLRLAKAPAFVCRYDTISTQRQLSKAEARAARADSRCSAYDFGTMPPSVDDGTGLAAITGGSGDDLRRAQAVLKAGGIVVTDPTYITNGTVTVQVIVQPTADGSAAAVPRIMQFPAYLLTSGYGVGPAIVSPGAISAAGLASQAQAVIGVTTRTPTTAEQDRLRGQLGGNADFYLEAGPPVDIDVRLWILIAAAGAVTLAAAGVATGLAAADGRQDLSTLAAVGASPRLRRGLSLSQSGVIAGLGSILGALAGTGAAIAILVALNQRILDEWPGPPTYPIALPWPSLAVALLVVPGIAMIGAGTLTRSRLPIERRH